MASRVMQFNDVQVCPYGYINDQRDAFMPEPENVLCRLDPLELIAMELKVVCKRAIVTLVPKDYL